MALAGAEVGRLQHPPAMASSVNEVIPGPGAYNIARWPFTGTGKYPDRVPVIAEKVTPGPGAYNIARWPFTGTGLAKELVKKSLAEGSDQESGP